ncbi:regulatory signaling modulator protein AmpE [Stenotrophomonas sp. YIM B06876]|uniref:regulatory signaling modulator protein AmpE n=1 Tax=Stenotrophomonas sp. YIM B06876 TaxID=3060211 RepID=UPI0027387409|nr:regulatory signaling modulator protein AmpE [Stenotrophomonas sp. YIM B06876]
MFTTLVAVIVALVLGHLVPAAIGAIRNYHWYGDWVRWLDARTGVAAVWRGRYGAALAVLPVVALVALLQWALHGRLFGLPALCFGVLVLVLCWGPRDLDRDVEAVIDADDATARRAAVAHLQAAGGSVHADVASLAEATLFNAMRRWFAPMFWFLLLGPLGAVLYRLLALVAEGPFAALLPTDSRRGAGTALALLEWPVAQLMVLSMALAGNFDTVFTAWRTAEGGRWALSSGFLGAVGKASVGAELRAEADEYRQVGMVPADLPLPELRDAMSLIWRMLLLWLVVLALLIIAGWVS